ncbi:glucosaminidase domain-containing protein [Vibrio tapetis subsp. quintayensis]|uniref:glucosaminidase domain-containing protein n=1 Tax=Vibrio tapetis TaxID=52443 RepID=UPI0025B4C831|nr:glucosaminidase domain-containing protein [Vibrio tapetis]MDN3679171.1 glucosaminidase domain-containing protein [Vibrio tapetis subsp. quintayensis]
MRNKVSYAIGISALMGLSGVGLLLSEEEQEQPSSVRSTTVEIPKEPQSPLVTVGDKPDFKAFTDVNEKKSAFFGYLKPKIDIENKRVLNERNALLAAKSALADASLTSERRSYITRIGKTYQLSLSEGAELTLEWIDQALERVNVLPPSMVMIQAANESAWGTSRFATQANNFFGQWCYREGCGLIPLQRNEGASHEVAKFSSVQQSVNAYFMNINRNRAYQNLRIKRLALEKEGASLQSDDTALALINELGQYSERGSDYISELQAMIRHNSKFWSENGS